jgi:LCP family protein required for cell wall assembly
MDNSNFKKRPGHTPRSHSSMDGFVTPDSFKRAGSLNFASPQEKESAPVESTQKLDDFNRTDGFHSSSQPIDGTSVQAPTLPAPLLDSSPRKRSKLNGRRGRRLSRGIRPKRPWLRALKRTALGFGTLILAVVLYFGFKIYIIEKNVLRGGGSAPALAQTIDISKLKGEGDGRVNILLLGIGGPGHDGPDLTDTMLIASIDPTNNQMALLSIPRDLWVEIPGNGSQKINAAFAYGKQQSKAKDEAGKTQDGLKLVDQTIAPVIGIPIHYHAVVDFTAFKQAVDAVGGVTFNVPEQLYDPTIAWENHNKSIIADKGLQSFDGAKALLYARSRETSTDFARSERQRQLMVVLKDKVLSAGTYSNPLKVSQLLSSFGNNVYTDFGSGDLSRLYQISSQIPSSSIFSLDLVTPPHNYLTTGTIDNLSVVEPRAGLSHYEDVVGYIRNALKDGFIAQENAQIVILNGTDKIGVASQKSKELKSFGYNITMVGDAPTKDYQHTTFVDLRKGVKKYTQNYLEKRLGVKATMTLPTGITPGTADFVIILGNDTQVTTPTSP